MDDGLKCKKCPPAGAPDWMVTYGDMVTLLLTFFVTMFSIDDIDYYELRMILAAFSGLGSYQGGRTLQAGAAAELGNTIMSLPAMQRGRALDKAKKAALSTFQPEIKTKKVRVTEDERGLVISLAADSFFKPASAEVDIEEARSVLQRLSSLLTTPDLSDRKFRIEGHTDSSPTDANSPYYSNWELSTARATNVLHYLVDFGVNEQQFQVSGLADTEPMADETTPEGQAYNRRVDVIILTDGHL
ncbi:flagellar motor protein MotB [Spirochaeta cellobiosiphila]|uniref:flagellar motor protein MotB n=1 Tax=Spirochaeta cellobiosiphila TaxID=504483 RepID=UPI000410D847|nr:flagellar motor protein MotB [Spirochaeta cellobiosiphila]